MRARTSARIAEAFEVQQTDVAAVEYAHHDAFAVDGWQRRDAEVDVLAKHPETNPAVLGQTALGDIELGHELDAGNYSSAHLARRRFDGIHHAINSNADAQLVFHRLDVNVTGAAFDGARNEQVHHANDGGFEREVAKMLGVFQIAEILAAIGLFEGFDETGE